MAKLKLKEKIHAFLQAGSHTPLKMKAGEWKELQEDKKLADLIDSAEQAQDAFRKSLETIEEYLEERT